MSKMNWSSPNRDGTLASHNDILRMKLPPRIEERIPPLIRGYRQCIVGNLTEYYFDENLARFGVNWMEMMIKETQSPIDHTLHLQRPKKKEIHGSLHEVFVKKFCHSKYSTDSILSEFIAVMPDAAPPKEVVHISGKSTAQPQSHVESTTSLVTRTEIEPGALKGSSPLGGYLRCSVCGSFMFYKSTRRPLCKSCGNKTSFIP